jgi:hypothetical protein
MAKKTQESLLGEVVQLLRKQNQLSTRDRLKEAEEAKRQEKADEAILNPNSKTSASGEPIVDDALDFKRRYKANIAGKITKNKMDEPKNKAKKKVQEVIKHSTFMTRRLIEKSNQMMYRINVQNTNLDMLRFKYRKSKDQEQEAKDEEYRREHGGEMFDFTKKFRKMITGFLSPRELARQKKREEWSIIKENWFKYGMIPLITAMTAGITLAYNGMHLWHAKTIKALAAVKTWGTTTIGAWLEGGKIATAYTALKTSIYAWFGYDKHGKPMYKKVDGQWKTFGWAGLTESVKTRLADLRMKAYNSMGLGEDGKKVVQKYTGGPRGSMPVKAAWTSVGFIGLVTRRIGKLLNPLVKVSGGIAKWTAKAPYKAIAATLKTFANLGAVKFIGRLLWPIAAIFSVFEGFKAGKAEAAEDDAKWYTILGEAGGGAIGYLVGGLADAIKGLTVWGITKLFGFKTDKDGNILPNQGIGGDALQAIKEFSFADLIRKIIAFPFHAISAIADYIGELFSDPIGLAGDAWDWITDMPNKFLDMIKGFVPDVGIQLPEWLGGGSWNLREALGIDAMAMSAAAGPDAIGFDKINPFTGKSWSMQERADMRDELGANWRTENQAGFLKMMYDFTSEQRAQGIYGGSGTAVNNNVTNIIQYKDEGYGDYIKSTRLEATM